jgi:hypothetical protein
MRQRRSLAKKKEKKKEKKKTKKKTKTKKKSRQQAPSSPEPLDLHVFKMAYPSRSGRRRFYLLGCSSMGSRVSVTRRQA